MKVLIGISRLNATQLADKSRHVEERMLSNANFPNPEPKITTVTAMREALEAANAAAQDRGRIAVALRRSLEKELRITLTQLAGHVASVAGTDEQIIMSSGFDVRRSPRRSGEPAAPTGLQARTSPIEGRVDLRWDREHNATVYHLFKSTDAQTWELALVSTKANARITGLVSGQAYWFRVAAIGTAGTGPFSDVARCRVF